jgi:hypothetical protein
MKNLSARLLTRAAKSAHDPNQNQECRRCLGEARLRVAPLLAYGGEPLATSEPRVDAVMVFVRDRGRIDRYKMAIAVSLEQH